MVRTRRRPTLDGEHGPTLTRTHSCLPAARLWLQELHGTEPPDGRGQDDNQRKLQGGVSISLDALPVGRLVAFSARC